MRRAASLDEHVAEQAADETVEDDGLGEGEAEPLDALELAAQLGLPRDRLDHRAEDVADTDAGAERAEADRRRRLDDTRRQIEAETRRALEQIRAEIAELSLVAAEKVTRRSLRDEDQRRLIDEAIGDLDFSVLERND